MMTAQSHMFADLLDDNPASDQQGELFPEFSVVLPSPQFEAAVADSFQAAQTLWNESRTRIQEWFSPTIWQHWLAKLTAQGLSDDTLTLGCPTVLVRDWVRTHHQDALLTLLQQSRPALRQIQLLLQDETALAPANENANTLIFTPAVANDVPELPEELPFDTAFTFDSFVVDKSNQFAFEAMRKLSESDKPLFNPMFIRGGVGLGKTHLMHALGQAIKARAPKCRVWFMSAEQFMFRFIRALRDKNALAFKEAFRSVDVLMIDDVQFICGKESTQEEFFHTFNSLIEQGKQIVLSADKAPGELTGVGSRLVSRMSMGLVAEIHPTSYELRLGILHAKLAQKRQQLPHEVVNYLAQSVTRNVRELEGALNQLLAQQSLLGLRLDLNQAKLALAPHLHGQSRRVTIEEIQNKVAHYYQLRVSDLQSARRARVYARPRQIAMHLAKQLTTASLPDIGRAFGGRDHTTVIHAVRTIENLMQNDVQLANDSTAIRQQLQLID